MADKNTSMFLKNESSISLNDGAIGNYLGGGVKLATSSGSYEGMLAFKANENSKGGFGEFKYTTPQINNFAIESRTRLQIESSGNSLTSRIAGKYSSNIGNFNIYEILGSTAKFSLEGNSTSITPLSLTGIGYNFNKNLGCYVEGEVSKSYNCGTKIWGNLSPACYLGVKYTF